MTKLIQKILLVAYIIISSQAVFSFSVQAQSYQRWIYWVGNENHQLTAQEMGEITEKLFNGEILPNKVFVLSNGVSLRIPQPSLFLRYIRTAVLSVRPWATERDQIVDAIYTADRFRWGNDVNVRVKNYWVSDQNKKVNYTNNYSGEGKNSLFLFIDGIPTIKCDCGNPLELLPEFYSFRHDQKSSRTGRSDFQTGSPVIQSQRPEPATTFVAPRTVQEMATARIPEQSPDPYALPPTHSKFNWKPVIFIGGTTFAIGTGLLLYSLLKKDKTTSPIIPPFTPVDPTGP
jgi:hypothetical protein